jgi:hypothetical protein
VEDVHRRPGRTAHRDPLADGVVEHPAAEREVDARQRGHGAQRGSLAREHVAPPPARRRLHEDEQREQHEGGLLAQEPGEERDRRPRARGAPPVVDRFAGLSATKWSSQTNPLARVLA